MAANSCWKWGVWGTSALVGGAYCALALFSFARLTTATRDIGECSGEFCISPSVLRNGLLAACFLGAFVVLTFIIVSGAVLLSDKFRQCLVGYGFLLGSALNTAFLLLLAALILNTSSSLMKSLKLNGNNPHWLASDYSCYVATYIFSYVLVAGYLILFLVLIFARGRLMADPGVLRLMTNPANLNCCLGWTAFRTNSGHGNFDAAVTVTEPVSKPGERLGSFDPAVSYA